MDVSVTIWEGVQSTQDYFLPPTCLACTNVGLIWTPTVPIQTEIITFTGIASGIEPITFCWDFGYRAFDLDQIVTHTFVNIGTCTVTLTVENCAAIPVIQ